MPLNPAMRPMGADSDVIHDTILQCDWNLLLMKVGQGTGNWQAIARFTDPSGNPIEGLKFSAEKPEDYGK